MQTCFVIQPFDSGKFDKRYESVFKPAIEAAGLESYRVDRDPAVEVPIDAIEDGIRNAAICHDIAHEFRKTKKRMRVSHLFTDISIW